MGRALYLAVAKVNQALAPGRPLKKAIAKADRVLVLVGVRVLVPLGLV